MAETFPSAVWWCAFAIGLAPVVLVLGWDVIEGVILPRLVPKAEIEQLAAELVRRYPANPEEAAFIEEHAAWHRSKIYEQGKWRRVRKLLRQKIP